MAGATPCLTTRPDWLRGLDLNQRPLGYEYDTAMSGNPLISHETRSTAGSSTLCVGAWFLLLFGPASGCCGSKIGAGVTIVYGLPPRPTCVVVTNVGGTGTSAGTFLDPQWLAARPRRLGWDRRSRRFGSLRGGLMASGTSLSPRSRTRPVAGRTKRTSYRRRCRRTHSTPATERRGRRLLGA